MAHKGIHGLLEENLLQVDQKVHIYMIHLLNT